MPPPQLKKGDKIAILAPSGSMNVVSSKILQNIETYFKNHGIDILFGETNNYDRYGNGGTIQERAKELMTAFLDKTINGIIPIFGGYTSNQILPYLDYKLIKDNPKFFMGYSDITTLNIAIFSKTGMTTYCGPGGTQLGHFFPSNYTLKYFEEVAFMKSSQIDISPSKKWTQGAWRFNGEIDERNRRDNNLFEIITPGIGIGTAFGGNLSTLSLLAGTEYMKIPNDPIIFLEECGEFSEGSIIRMLEQMHQIGLFQNAKGIVFGRFEEKSKIRMGYLLECIKTYITQDIPIIINADFGHTEPMFTIPLGAITELNTEKNMISFFI